MNDWKDCKNILVIRADNMGDLLMSSPAINALKQSFDCRLTLLTSEMGNVIAPFIPGIDETIVANVPWVKTKKPADENALIDLIQKLRSFEFDAAIIFTVYSQNPLPAAMLAFLAGIPKRLAYCRENPYSLLTNWQVEKEPYSFIQHQVKRDLQLVESVGATTKDTRLRINVSENAKKKALEKLLDLGLNPQKDWIIMHPGVSELKREYPVEKWIHTGKMLRDQLGFQLIITGSKDEKSLTEKIQSGIGNYAVSAAGFFSMEEFIALISLAPMVISVNTGTVHIAAATQTPVIVLYALTNPQHTPWKVPSKTLYFSVKDELQSRNEIVNFVSANIMEKNVGEPAPEEIILHATRLLKVIQE